MVLIVSCECGLVCDALSIFLVWIDSPKNSCNGKCLSFVRKKNASMYVLILKSLYRKEASDTI